MSEDLKENMCRILFDCKDFDGNVCSHNDSIDRCKYSKSKTTSGICLSSVARVNAMTIELKKMGVDFILIGKLDEIKAKLKDAVRTSGLKPVEEVIKILEDM